MKSPQRPAVRMPLVAGTRDASWYNRPDVRSVKAHHIATDEDSGACAPGPVFNSGTIALNDFTYGPAADVYDDLRCRRPGCKKHWDTVPSKPRRATGSSA